MTTYATGNPIGSVDVKDLYDNAQNLDVFVNDRTKRSEPDRLGVERKTWWGVEQDFQDFLLNSGYQSLGDYAAGIEITARNQFVWKDGELYRVDDSVTLPYTTTGVWLDEEPLFVAIGDRVLRQQLADTTDPSNGATMVGYKPPYAGAAALTQAQLNDLGLTAPYIELFGAKGDGVTDNALAFQAAIDSGVKKIKVGPGHFRIDSDVVGTSNITIEGSGPDTILDFYNGTGQLKIEGSYTALPAPSGQVLTNAAWVEFSAPPDLKQGDVFFLYNPTDYSWNGTRAYYRKGEFLQVHSVVGNRVNIYGGTSDSYATGTFDAYKVNPVCLNLNNLKIIESNTPSKAPVHVVFGVGVRISNVYGTSSQYAAIVLQQCYDFAVSDVSALNNSSSVSDEYGIIVSNSQKGAIRGGGTSATRHAVTIGGSDYVGCVPCRYIDISSMTLDNFNTLAGDGGGQAPAGDLHSNSEFITYDNCVFRNGTGFNGANNTIRNSTIFPMRDSVAGIAVYGSEVVRGVMTLENCVIYVNGDGFTGNFGFISLRGGAALMQNSDVVIRNITFRAIASGVTGTSASLVNLIVDTSTSSGNSINTLVDGVHCILSGATWRSVLVARSTDGVTPLMSTLLSVDNISVAGGPDGAYLIYPHATITNVPTREMAQSGAVDVTTTAASLAVVGPQNFRFRYSKKPYAQVTYSSGTGALESFIGTIAGIAMAYDLTDEYIRPAVLSTTSSTNFVAGEAVRLNWSVGIGR